MTKFAQADIEKLLYPEPAPASLPALPPGERLTEGMGAIAWLMLTLTIAAVVCAWATFLWARG
jgi:hypothetical protein